MMGDKMTGAIATFYFLVMAWRLYSLRALLKVPMFHGSDHLFDTHVGPEFYAGQGRGVLRQYRRQLLAPHVIELAFIIAVAWLYPGNFFYLMYLLMAAAVIGGWWHVRVLRRWTKEAWRYESPKQGPAPSAVAVALQTRKVSDYKIPAVEWAIRGFLVAGLALLFYAAASDHFRVPWTEMFFLPALCLYGLAGIALVQRALIEARLVRIPAERPQTLIVWREELRRFWLRMCDAMRAFLVAPLFLWAVLAIVDERQGELWQTRLFHWPIWALVALVFVFLLRGLARFVEASKKVGPVRGAKPEPPMELTRPLAGIFCWEQELPAVLVKCARWYRVNLANARTYLYAAYFGGFGLFAAWIKLAAK